MNPGMITSDFKEEIRDQMKNSHSQDPLEAMCLQEDQMYVEVAQEAIVVQVGR